VPPKKSHIKLRQEQAPERSQRQRNPDIAVNFRLMIQQVIQNINKWSRKLNRSIYYQRDIYQPRTQRVWHRAGELIPGGPDAAQKLKEELDRLVVIQNSVGTPNIEKMLEILR